MKNEVETKKHETEETLRTSWLEYRRDARRMGIFAPEEFLEYLIRRLNNAEESTYQDGYVDGYKDGQGDKPNDNR